MGLPLKGAAINNQAPAAASPGESSSALAPRRLSPSALDAYRECPRRFYHRVIARTGVAEEPSAMLVVAAAIHHALERFFGLRPAERSREVLHDCLRSVWPDHRAPGAFLNEDEERAEGLRALGLLDDFYDGFDTNAEPVARERWVATRLANGFTVFGKVDRADRVNRIDGPDAVSVIDYKTGRRRLEREDLRTDSAAMVYAVASAAAAKRDVDAVRLLHLPGAEEVRWELDDGDLEAARERLVDLTDTIGADRDFAATPGDCCRFCDYAWVCPDAQRVELQDLEVVDAFPF